MTPEEAYLRTSEELVKRRMARSSIIHYSNMIAIPGKPAKEDPETELFLPVETTVAKHHKLIMDTCTDATTKPYGRAMLLMPPGSAKSTYASAILPSYLMGKNPNYHILVGSYSDKLSIRHGKKAKSIIAQPRFRDIFRTGQDPLAKSGENWKLTNGSEFTAFGLMSGVTGLRANGVIIDDPIKGRQAAKSQTVRETIWETMRDDIMSRLLPGAWAILILTRWHEDDPAGRLLPDDWNGESGIIRCKDGFYWNVVCIKAKAEDDNDILGRKPGEYLWPEWFGREHWAMFEKYPSTWNSLFQQRPSADEGNLFKPEAITFIDEEPEGVRWVRAWDLAASEGEGDWTVGVKIGTRGDGLIIADMVRGQWGPDTRDVMIRKTAERDGRKVKINLPQDPGQAGKSQVGYYQKMLTGFLVETSPESGDKEVRAEPMAAETNLGNVAMVRAGWNSVMIDEMRNFPMGKHDDIIDAISRGGNMLLLKRSPWDAYG